jgi:ElaB/YqjD/DUF883 family membrane-anchored ribosome-binding protein
LPALKAQSKKQLLQELAARCHALTHISERRIFETLVERERLGTTLAQSRELSARAREQMQRSVEASRDVVVHRPLSAIAMSVAVGLVAGLLLSRRS